MARDQFNRMLVRVVFRVFIDGHLERAMPMDINFADLRDLQRIAETHAEMLADSQSKGMIEIEFLDEPNLEQRFFRIGTDPAGMVAPVAVDILDDPNTILAKWDGKKASRPN